MGEIEIAPGETAELIDKGDTRRYELEIQEGKCRFATNAPRASAGRIRSTGDRGLAQNAGGSGLYAYSADGATVSVDAAEFSLDLYGESNVTSAGERAIRDGLDYSVNTQANIPSGGANTTLIGVENTEDVPFFAVQIAVAFEQAYNPNVTGFIVKFREDDSVEQELPFRVGQELITLDPPIRVDPGEQLNVNIQNYDAAAVDLEGTIRYRENP